MEAGQHVVALRLDVAPGGVPGGPQGLAARVRGLLLQAGAFDCFVDVRGGEGEAEEDGVAHVAVAPPSQSAAVAHRPSQAPSSQVSSAHCAVLSCSQFRLVHARMMCLSQQRASARLAEQACTVPRSVGSSHDCNGVDLVKDRVSGLSVNARSSLSFRTRVNKGCCNSARRRTRALQRMRRCDGLHVRRPGVLSTSAPIWCTDVPQP